MADLEEKNKNPSQTSATALAEPQKTQPEKFTADECHLKELHDNRFEKKGARRAFHLLNFLGLHQIFNNTTSVVITFMLATTGLAGKMKDGMANGPIGKGLSAVLTAPSKVINFGFKLCGKDFNKNLTEKDLEFIAHEANRNAIETAFMTIAGFVALLPVYYLEKHRAGFLNTVDNWLHPGRTKEEKKAAALTPEDEPKETVWNLFRARIIALAAVFGIDQIRTNFDRILRDNHKIQNKPEMYKNVESVAGWGFGDWIYRHMGDKTRNRVARFFSGSLDIWPEKMRGWFKKIGNGNLQDSNLLLSKIQDETRGDVLKVTKAPQPVIDASEEIAALGQKIRESYGNEEAIKGFKNQIKDIDSRIVKTHFKDVERAVFAEQSRLFWTKEFFLTTVLSAIIYYCAKAPSALKFMEKIGLAKKGTYEKEHAKLEARRHPKAAEKKHDDAKEADDDSKKWAVQAQKRDVKKEHAPATSFTEAAVNSQNQEATASLG